MRALLAVMAALGAASCIPEAKASQPALELAAELSAFVPPLSISDQVSAQLGMSVEVPRALASLPPADLASLVQALPAGVPLEVVSFVPGVGPAYPRSFSVNCDNSAAFAKAVVDGVDLTTPAVGRIEDPWGGNMISYTCQNTTTTLVEVGDSAKLDPGTTRKGPVYCSTNCPAQEFGGNLRLEYCRGDTDTTIRCRAMVAVSGPHTL